MRFVVFCCGYIVCSHCKIIPASMIWSWRILVKSNPRKAQQNKQARAMCILLFHLSCCEFSAPNSLLWSCQACSIIYTEHERSYEWAGGRLKIKLTYYQYRDPPHYNILDKTVSRLIFIMEIPIPEKTVFVLRRGPGSLAAIAYDIINVLAIPCRSRNLKFWHKMPSWIILQVMMTSSNGNILRVTVPLWGEFTGHRWISLTKAGDAELWCFLWSACE